MKIKTILMAFAISLLTLACQVSDFEDNYTDPSRISQTSVEKQYTGFMIANRTYVLPSYWNYFVVLRITLNRYNQAVGWENVENQYVPGSAAITDRWNNYYSFLGKGVQCFKLPRATGLQGVHDYRSYLFVRPYPKNSRSSWRYSMVQSRDAEYKRRAICHILSRIRYGRIYLH